MSVAEIETNLGQIAENFQRLRESAAPIFAAADTLIVSLRSGGNVLFCGNGGSAADAQHLAAARELGIPGFLFTGGNLLEFARTLADRADAPGSA